MNTIRRIDRRQAVDLHFHVLPGVDDGPATLEDSLELVWAAVADGTGTIVATPHVRPDFVDDVLELPGRVAELRAALARHQVPVTVLCGGELGHTMVARLSQAELEILAQGPHGARWLLVETPFEGIGADFEEATDELRDRGFGVLLAHPERSADAAIDGAAGLRRQLAAGALAQLNAGSLAGWHGEAAMRAAWSMAAEGLAAVVASDAHGPTRPPALRSAELALGRDLPDLAMTLPYAGPRRVLARGLGQRRPVSL